MCEEKGKEFWSMQSSPVRSWWGNASACIPSQNPFPCQPAAANLSSTSLPSRTAQDWYTLWWKECGVAEPKLENCLAVRHLHLMLIYFQLLYCSSLYVIPLLVTLYWTIGPASLLFLHNFEELLAIDFWYLIVLDLFFNPPLTSFFFTDQTLAWCGCPLPLFSVFCLGIIQLKGGSMTSWSLSLSLCAQGGILCWEDSKRRPTVPTCFTVRAWGMVQKAVACWHMEQC